jgi:hypothetical protein
LTAAATLVFAAATLALAELRFVPLLVVSIMAGGMAWVAMMSSLTVQEGVEPVATHLIAARANNRRILAE